MGIPTLQNNDSQSRKPYNEASDLTLHFIRKAYFSTMRINLYVQQDNLLLRYQDKSAATSAPNERTITKPYRSNHK